MRLRAQIVIDIDADDFAEAAAHQTRVEQAFLKLQESYSGARLEFRQRRERPLRRTVAQSGPLHYTGKMGAYED
jgi:hypothetical protein